MMELLYKKKIIRDFLSLFTENYWKQLITSIVEYGIINFKKHHNIASLTPDEIIQIVESLKKDENLEDKKKLNNILSLQKSKTKSRSKSKDTDIKSSTKLIKKDSIPISNYKTSKTPSRESSVKSNLKTTKSIKTNLNKLKPQLERTNSIKLKSKLNNLSSDIDNDRIHSNRLNSKNPPKKTIITNKPKVNNNEIIEQININKLKEKRNKRNTSDLNNLSNSIINQQNISHQEESVSTNSISKASSKKFLNVESKIKSALLKDKQNYLSMKQDDTNSVKDINSKASLLSLEERLNGLTQKINDKTLINYQLK